MWFDRIAVIALATSALVVPAASAHPPFPDPGPGAQHRANVSGSYWIDLPLYAGDQVVHGAKGRCRYRAHRPRRCFVIRVGVR